MAKKTKNRKSPENRGTSRGRENLRLGVKFRWQPGQSGNPGGRPKFAEMSKACRDILSQPMPKDKSRTFAMGIARKLADMAIHGNVAAASELADRSEGRPRQALDINERENPLLQLVEAMNRESARIGPPQGMTVEEMKNELVQ